MTISCVRAGPAAAAASGSAPAATMAAPTMVATTPRRTSALLAERRLQALRVLQMRHERRSHRDEQALQLGVLRARDQRLVDGVEHLLVVGDLVVDVGALERRTLQLLQVPDVLGASRLEALAGRVVFGRDLE